MLDLIKKYAKIQEEKHPITIKVSNLLDTGKISIEIHYNRWNISSGDITFVGKNTTLLSDEKFAEGVLSCFVDEFLQNFKGSLTIAIKEIDKNLET